MEMAAIAATREHDDGERFETPLVGEGVRHLLLVAEEPPSLAERRDRNHRAAAEEVIPLDDGNPVPREISSEEVGVGRTVEGDLEPRLGLKLAVTVEDERKTGGADADVADQFVEGLEVDRGLDEVPLVTLRARRDDDEMRGAAKPGEHVADIVFALSCRLEPLRGRVVGHGEVEGAGIGDLHALAVHQSEVDEGAVVLLAQDVEKLAQKVRVFELGARVFAGDDANIRQPIFDEGVDGLGVALHDRAEVIVDLEVVGGAELVQVDGPGDHHRRHRDDGQCRHDGR